MKQVKTHCGLFVGLVTLDLIYLATSAPSNNQKIVASDYTVASGGPATNAAVTFNQMGQSTLLGLIGAHPMTQLIQADLASYGVAIADLDPEASVPPPISSIIVTQGTGERAVVSINALNRQGKCDRIPNNMLSGIDIVLIDGHQMAVGQEIARQARAYNIPVVIDGGSWKPGMEKILPFVDYAICAANFSPPECHSTAEVFRYLAAAGIPHIAITHGEKPIQYLWHDTIKTLDVPQVDAVDTLGAGDVFHGAFCNYILKENFVDALAAAAKIAAYSCQFFGTRRWLENNLNKLQ